MVQRRLGRAIVGTPDQGDKREARRGVDERRFGRLGLQERQERLGQSDEGEIVCDELLVDEVDVDGLGLGEVEGPLHAGIEEDAIEVTMRRRDVGGEVGDAGEVRDVEGDC